MVKWLSEISVAPEESQNFYHFHDNRVLPPGVDQEKAKAEGETTFTSRCDKSTCADGLLHRWPHVL